MPPSPLDAGTPFSVTRRGTAVVPPLDPSVTPGSLGNRLAAADPLHCIRAARTDGQTLSAEGTVIHTGLRTATAEGRVLDEQGKLIAHATPTCMILPAGG